MQEDINNKDIETQNRINPDQNFDFQNQLNNQGQSICGLENLQTTLLDHMNVSKDEKPYLYDGLAKVEERIINLETQAEQILNNVNCENQKTN